MTIRACVGALLGLWAVGCGLEVDQDRPVPAAYEVPAYEVPAYAVPAYGLPAPMAVGPGYYGPGPDGTVPTQIAGGELALTGHLEGRLQGVDLSANTTQNSGSFAVWEGGGGYMSMTIAAEGRGGAGMLIVNLASQSLEAELSGGQWLGSATDLYDPADSMQVSSCAGPVMGDWPNEAGAVDYEASAEEDPEDPGTVVLVIKAEFPVNGYNDTSELVGTLRFPVLPE